MAAWEDCVMNFIICTVHTIILNRSRWTGWTFCVACMGAVRNAYNLGGKFEGYGPRSGGCLV